MEQRETRIFGIRLATRMEEKREDSSEPSSGIPLRLRLAAALVLAYQSLRHPLTDGYLELDARNNSVTMMNLVKERKPKRGK